MLLASLIFLLGSVILYFGADWLIKGASRLALSYGIRPMVVGLTVVALGTSLPEFMVNIVAALQAESELALGNIIGSNISNIGLILGVTALILPVSISSSTLKKEYVVMMAVMSVFYLMGIDGMISRLNGALLILGLAAFLTFLYVDSRRNPQTRELLELDELEQPHPESISGWKILLLIFGGMLGLLIGARLMVIGAVQIAESLGISRIVIGLTVVAIGTSLPELAASVMAVMKKESDLSVGNVLGSNLFNVLFVVGFVAAVEPLPVTSESVYVHFPIMLLFGLLLLPMAWMGKSLGRIDGSLLLFGFVAYLVFLIWPYV